MPEYRELDHRDIVRFLAFVLLVLLGWGGVLAIVIVLLARWPAVMMLAFLLLTVALVWGLLRWHSRSFAYRCPTCGHIFTLTTGQDLISPNLGTRKLVRCPACGETVKATGLKIVSR